MNVARRIEDVETKDTSQGVLYRVKKFLGLASDEERKNVEQITGAVTELNRTIDNLESLAAQVSDDQARQILLRQAEQLKDRRDRLQNTAAKKRKSANGIFSIFS